MNKKNNLTFKYYSDLGLFYIKNILKYVFTIIKRVVKRNIYDDSDSINNQKVIKSIDFPDRQLFIKIESNVERNSRAKACMKEPFTVDWIRNIAHKGIFYDVGANVGSYSLIAASLMSKKSKVVAFEPAYFNFYELNENIRINNLEDKIIPINIALADKNSLIKMNFSSIDKGSAFHILENRIQKSKYNISILTLTLDIAIKIFNLPFPNHIKIDVDGYELTVLKGAERTLSDIRTKSVMIETDETSHLDEALLIDSYMREKRFKLSDKYDLPMSTSKKMFNNFYIRF